MNITATDTAYTAWKNASFNRDIAVMDLKRNFRVANRAVCTTALLTILTACVLTSIQYGNATQYITPVLITLAAGWIITMVVSIINVHRHNVNVRAKFVALREACAAERVQKAEAWAARREQQRESQQMMLS